VRTYGRRLRHPAPQRCGAPDIGVPLEKENRLRAAPGRQLSSTSRQPRPVLRSTRRNAVGRAIQQIRKEYLGLPPLSYKTQQRPLCFKKNENPTDAKKKRKKKKEKEQASCAMSPRSLSGVEKTRQMPLPCSERPVLSRAITRPASRRWSASPRGAGRRPRFSPAPRPRGRSALENRFGDANRVGRVRSARRRIHHDRLIIRVTFQSAMKCFPVTEISANQPEAAPTIIRSFDWANSPSEDPPKLYFEISKPAS